MARRKRCPICGKLIPKTAHVRRIYCSTTCSNRAYYLRNRDNPAWWQNKLEIRRRWCAEHREKVNAWQRQYQQQRKHQAKRARFARIMEKLHGT